MLRAICPIAKKRQAVTASRDCQRSSPLAQAYAENLVLIYYVYGVHMYRSVDGVVVTPWRALNEDSSD